MRIRPLLDEYLTEELSAEQMMEVEAHLCDCTDCRDALEEMRQIKALLGEYGTVEAPASLQPAVMRQIADARAQSVWRKRIRWLSTAAAAIMVMVVAFTFVRAYSRQTREVDSHSDQNVVALSYGVNYLQNSDYSAVDTVQNNVVRSNEELKSYLHAGNESASAGEEETLYDDAFFSTKTLIVVRIAEDDVACRYEVIKVLDMGDHLQVDVRRIPDDHAERAYNILIEVDVGRDVNNDEVKVNIVDE